MLKLTGYPRTHLRFGHLAGYRGMHGFFSGEDGSFGDGGSVREIYTLNQIGLDSCNLVAIQS